MEKLYKRIVFFVGLIAMNITVQAQLGVYSSFFSVSSKTLIIKPNLTSSIDFNSKNSDWAGITRLNPTKEVSNFTNYPNPATTQTTIAYTLSAKTNVNLRVIDLTGKQLAMLVKQEQAAGRQEYVWEFAKHKITSGMYILILQADNKIFSRKMIVQ